MPNNSGPASWEERQADEARERAAFEQTGRPSWEQQEYTITEVKLPMPLDTLIKVGMLADIEGHGERIPIEGISVTLCPRRDPAAEGSREDHSPEPATAVFVRQIEAALLPYAVFDFGGHWAYGRQVRHVYEKGAEHEG